MSATVHQLPTGKARELKTPFADLVPPLSATERESLETQLRTNGQTDPVLVDEDDNILDGHNRYAILGANVITKTIAGLTYAEKRGFVCGRAYGRRNLSAEQKRVMQETMKRVALELRAEDPKRNTQEHIATNFGVSQQTVSNWLKSDVTSICNAVITDLLRPDARSKYAPEVRAEALRRVAAGEKQTAVAASIGMPVTTLNTIVHKHAEKAEVEPPKVANPRTLAKETRDAEIAKLYSYMPAKAIAKKLGVSEDCVRHAIRRLGMQRGNKGRKRNPISPLEKGLTVMRGQFMLWTEDDAREDWDGASPAQLRTVLILLDEVAASVRVLRRQLKEA